VKPIVVGGPALDLSDLAAIAAGTAVSLAPEAPERVARSRALVEDVLRRGDAVYGVNTGFGALKSVRVPDAEVERLQLNLLRSHAAGFGPELPDPAVRLMLALRAHSLALGLSGVRLELIERLLALLAAGILPIVPSRGSLGASGDLIPLAHLALALVGEGESRRDGVVLPTAQHLKQAGLSPITLSAKEGLALINGTQAAAALGALALAESVVVLSAAHGACALSVEALRGSAKPFGERVHAARPHPGQVKSAATVRRLLQGSGILASHAECGRVQDPYSLRCAPQVLGASIQAVRYAWDVLLTEVNSVTDNPLCFPESGEIVSAGNFHGQPLAQALDFLAIGMAEVGAIAERRTFLLLDPGKSDLPPFLSREAGLTSGLMIVQYLQAALVSENKMLAQPASIDSIPTSAGQEDHVSMAMHAAVKALTLVGNVRRIVAAELLCAAQGIEFLRPLRSSPQLESLLAGIRELVPPLLDDRRQDQDLARLDSFIAEGGVPGCTGISVFG